MTPTFEQLVAALQYGYETGQATFPSDTMLGFVEGCGAKQRMRDFDPWAEPLEGVRDGND